MKNAIRAIVYFAFGAIYASLWWDLFVLDGHRLGPNKVPLVLIPLGLMSFALAFAFGYVVTCAFTEEKNDSDG